MRITVWPSPRLLLVLLLMTVSLVLAGCAHKTSTPTPLPTGAVDQFDATAYRVVHDAGASIDSVNSDIRAGKLTMTESQRAVFYKFIASYNVAEDAGKAYHDGRANDPKALAGVVGQLLADMAELHKALVPVPEGGAR